MVDITGKKFNRLTAIKVSHKDKRGECHWLCKCDCGNYKIVSSYKIRTGNTKSCGCYKNECLDGRLRRTHGMSNTKLYTVWENMKQRCFCKNNSMYNYYGGRGITVCDKWKNDFSFFAEWALSHGYRDNLTIERINVNGNYEPENCKWIEIKDQYLNRTDSHFLTAFGKTQTIKEWSDESGIKYDTIERRINAYGWDAEKAVSVKPRSKVS